MTEINEKMVEAAVTLAMSWHPSEGGLSYSETKAEVLRQLSAALPLHDGGWQPIETAPKDGRKIDLLYPGVRGRTIDCFWRQDEVTGPDGGWFWLTPQWKAGELLPESKWYWNSYPNMEPTHWRERPAPPVIVADK